MAFSTLVFPFVFLPVSLILYFVLPKRLKNAALVVCSLVFFAWGTPEYLVLMVLDIAFHYFAGRELALQKARGRSGRFVLVSSVLVNLLLLGFFKYYGFLVDNLNALLGTALRARELPMPIGVSFFTFSLLSYLFDVYRDRAPAARNVLDFSLYVTFFPKLVSGPIVQYAEMEPQLRDHPVTREGFGSGARLFLIGLAVSSIWAAVFAFVGSIIAICTALILGGGSTAIIAGLFQFSAVLTAIGLGTTFYNPNWRVVCYTFLGTVFTVVAQGALNVLLNVYGIPTLTFPFVVAAWIFLLPNIDLLPKNYQS